MTKTVPAHQPHSRIPTKTHIACGTGAATIVGRTLDTGSEQGSPKKPKSKPQRHKLQLHEEQVGTIGAGSMVVVQWQHNNCL